jgi:N-acetylneuraminic acid mutarotase
MEVFHFIPDKVKEILNGKSCWLIWLATLIWLVGGAECFSQPAAPSGLVATAITSQEIVVAWTDNSTNELGFQLEQSSDGISFTVIADTAANIYNYAALNLNPGVEYYFRVCAFNAAGNSAYSNTNSDTTLTPWVQWQLANFTPAQLTNDAVSGVGANPAGDGLVNLFKYAFSLQPLLPDNTNLAWAGVDTILTSNFPTLNYRRSAAAIDVQFGAYVSGNLATLASGTNLATGPIPVSTNAGFVTEKFRANTPMASVPNQFMQLTVSYHGVPNTWITGPPMPLSMTEMSCGWLGDNLYVTGFTNGWSVSNSAPTLVYNIISNSWSLLNPDRPYKGSHHAVEVYNGCLYLIGGLDCGADGQVQIYNPATNGWSLGARAPYLAGSCCSALINGKIYIAGGLVGVIDDTPNLGVSTNAAAVYDPVANTWTSLPPIPFTPAHGINHAASATDGTNFYIFGGRDDDHSPAIGYTEVQIYYPASNVWVSSSSPGSTLTPLPQARGGMGKAVYYNGDFYVMGGETVSGGTGATAGDVYNRVDIYNVASNTWRLGTPMPLAKHGLFPTLHGNRIYVPGGGPIDGPYYSSEFDIYILP